MDFPAQVPIEIRRRLRSLGVCPEDVAESFIRGSGPGGQKINKTASTVVLAERASGVEVRCQRERSQVSNRLLAWRELCERLEEARRRSEERRRGEREKQRRRIRQKSRAQKRIMVEQKRRRTRKKQLRHKPAEQR